jgi:translocation and assembly module TamB
MTWKRILVALAALVTLAIGASVLVLRSSWFHDKIRAAIVSTVADATGGRVSIGAFRFDWKQMRAEVSALQIAGREAAGKPPLFRADSVTVGLKILSLWKRDVDVRSLDIRNPRIYLVFYPDGSTNIPAPKVKNSGRTMETILNLAIGSFQVRNGIFEIESQGRIPFGASGRNLNAALHFDPSGPRYRGDLAIARLDTAAAGYTAAWSLAASADFEKDRIALTSARLASGDSMIQLSGSLDNLAAPRALARFEARVAAADAGRVLRVKLLDRGTAELAGTARWLGGARYLVEGKLHAYGLDYRGPYVRLIGFRADGAISANPEGIGLSGVRLSGEAEGIPLQGQVAAISVHARDLDFRGIALDALGGTFRGDAGLRDLRQFRVAGQIAGFEARRVVALYSPRALPWNSRVNGTVQLEGLLQRKYELRAAADLALEPADAGAPVRGRIRATYDTRTDLLDLGRSRIELPNSRARFSGVLGQEMQVRLETRNLDDLLPVLGSRAAALPVKLENGAAAFDGAVTGKLEDPRAAGHLTLRNFSWSGEKFDSLAADITVSAANASLRDATLARGSLRAQFEGVVDLHHWSVDDSSRIAGGGSIENAGLADLAAMLHGAPLPIAGTLSGSAQVNGTIGNPIVKGDVAAVKGALRGEPFDRVAAHLEADSRSVSAANGELAAGAKQVRFNATFDHPADSLATGRLRFRVSTNRMPLEAIETIHRDRPDVEGMVEISAEGAVQLVAPEPGELGIRVSALQADVAASGLRAGRQILGDAHLTAATAGQALRVRLDSDFAGSTIHGDGSWRLEGAYPGSATIAFSRIDFTRLLAWVAPGQSGIADRITGWAEGEVRLEGPALEPRSLKGELRVPSFELTAASGDKTPPITLRNSGPLVASLSPSEIVVNSMRLVGRATDLAVTGRVSLDRQTPDLRVNGRVDLAVLHDFNPDFRASGTLTADATIRGTFAAPAVTGRTEFHNATFQVADLPNGLSNTNGVITFAGDRATIQSLSGETGGGKVTLTGFAAYSSGQPIFRIHARVDQVRVRYPEGVSTLADANLNFTGSLDRSMLAGTVTIRRTGFNPQSDFSSLIAQSVQPVETPSARGGLLGGMGFDIQINSAPDIEFESSLTQDLQVEANLRLRGAFSNPALLGRVTLTQGQVIFFGTRYHISQGSISFFNPLRIEPIFDVDLETKARQIDITLSVTGPLNKLNLTPRSDPPLQFSEIVALLATGRTPTNDPALLAQQATSPQSWQQLGASALLGQAIASPVAGRLQRFFGVSNLRIDPSLPGTEGTPQARVTLEQQVTPDITFTYITNITTSNPQVVQVEWAFSKQWSAVAIREDNGMFGIDFLFRKRF